MAGTDSLEQIAASLIAGITGVQDTDSTKDWFVSIGAMMDSAIDAAPGKAIADRQIAIYEGPGYMKPDPSWSVVYPTFQIVVRGKPNDYFAVRQMGEQIFQRLQSNEAPLGDQWVYFENTNGPLQLGIDDKKRVRLAWNFHGMRNTPPLA